MSYKLFSMAFADNSCVLDFKRCLFEYKDQRFMLYSSDNEYYMTIDTIIDNSKQNEESVFKLCYEFLYLFGWHNHCYFNFLDACSMSAPSYDFLLKRTQPLYRVPRRFRMHIPFLFMTDENVPEDFIKAISLYNQAKYTNDPYNTLLCLYKIIDLPLNGKTRDPVEWINENIASCNYYLEHKDRIFNTIGIQDNLGLFIKDECRNAIAHIYRYNCTKSVLWSYVFSDIIKISRINFIMFELAKLFINKVNKQIKSKSINVIMEEKE